MSDPSEPEKTQKEMLDAIKKMMSQLNITVGPQTAESRPEAPEAEEKSRRDQIHFDLKPKDVKKHLDRYVIKQEEAKRVLSTAVCDHFQHIMSCKDPAACKQYVKQNVLMLGPTGVGKTYLIRSLSELIGVPFVKADATKFSETGYVGGDVEDLIRELVHKAGGDIALAECGIVYLDEVDKIASAANLHGRDVSGAGVQRGLLKIMEETDIALRHPQDIQSQLQAMLEFQKKGKVTRPMINTRHILFIASGAFGELSGAIEKRIRSSQIGFSAALKETISKEDLFRQSKTEDFIQFGFEPEFVGRLPVRVVCDALNAEDLYRILTTSEGSILKQYEESFRAYGIQMHYEDSALWEIAKSSSEEATGARGLVTILEKIFRDFKYELPSSRVRNFVLTREMVLSPKNYLEDLLKEERTTRILEIQKEIKEFEQIFHQKHGLRIEFAPDALEMIQKRVLAEELEVPAFLEKQLSNYPYGLGLIQKRKSKAMFLMAADNIQNPNAVLEQWIKDAYEP